MFRGATAINMDAKGRIAVPAKYRSRFEDVCSNQIVVTIDLFDPCLLLFPLPHWEQLEAKLDTFSNTDPNQRRIKRMLLGHASEHEIDSNGRILLPPVLREYAQLEKQLLLAGQGKTFQIWNEENWHKKIEQDVEALAEGPLDPESLPELAF